MTNNLEKVEQALNELRKSLYTHDNSYQYIPNYYPFSGASQTFEKNTRDLLDVSYSLLYKVKEQRSEIEKLKKDVEQKTSLTDDDQVVIWVDDKYSLVIKILTTNVSLTLLNPELPYIGAYPYKEVKEILCDNNNTCINTDINPSLQLLNGHDIKIVSIKEFNQKFNTHYNFLGLSIYED